MPTFEYHGDTPGSTPILSLDAGGNFVEVGATPVSGPFDYLQVGAVDPVVGRRFAKGERVEAAANPDPACFTEII